VLFVLIVVVVVWLQKLESPSVSSPLPFQCHSSSPLVLYFGTELVKVNVFAVGEWAYPGNPIQEVSSWGGGKGNHI